MSPQLPEPAFYGSQRGGLLREDGYTADQMRAYAEEAIASSQYNLLRAISDIRQKTGVGDKPMLSELADAVASVKREPQWLPIESAPKGSGGGSVTAPDYIKPPHILILFADGMIGIGYWDWYYAESGRGYEGGLAWIDQTSGERLDMHYCTPIAWMPLPQPPFTATTSSREDGNAD